MIHINIGSNLDSKHGTRLENISIAIKLLVDANLKIKKISKLYETPSYPNKRFPKYFNVGLLAEYKFTYEDLFRKINLIEKKMGRFRTKKNDPRTCDIDIIDFYGIIKKKGSIILPHPRSHIRNFVLYPIKEIDPNWIHPIFKKNIDFFINELSQKSRIEITRLNKSVIIQI